MSLQKTETVELGEIKVSTSKTTVFTVSNIGTGVVVVLYDFEAKVAALAHVVLPDSTLGAPSEDELPAKYADLAVPVLLAQYEEAGGDRTRTTVKVVGGAQLFNFGGGSGNILNIGARNHTAIQQALMKESMAIDKSDSGGNKARQLRCVVANGNVMVKVLGGDEYPV